jgi:hypothetical protein
MSTERQIEIEKIAFILREEKFWTQNADAHDANGRPVPASSSKAVCFCLQGAEIRGLGKAPGSRAVRITRYLSDFNDTSTYREVWNALVKMHKACSGGKPEVLFDNEGGGKP